MIEDGCRTEPRAACLDVGMIAGSPCWYDEDRGPQAAVSDVGDPPERQASLRVVPKEAIRRCAVRGAACDAHGP
jgi:hypothetical protein